MGGIRGRWGRKKDRIYDRVRRRVCLNAMLTARGPSSPPAASSSSTAASPALFITLDRPIRIHASYVNRLSPHVTVRVFNPPILTLNFLSFTLPNFQSC